MRDFRFLVADERQSVPELLVVTARDEARAREIAERILAQSCHFRAVEVLEDGLPVFSIAKADPLAA